MGGITIFGYIGQIAGVLVATILAFALSDEQMVVWGWRVVFFVGALPTLLGYTLAPPYE